MELGSGGFKSSWMRSTSMDAAFRKRWLLIFFIFIPIPGEMIQFDEHIFQMGGSTNNYREYLPRFTT